MKVKIPAIKAGDRYPRAVRKSLKLLISVTKDGGSPIEFTTGPAEYEILLVTSQTAGQLPPKTFTIDRFADAVEWNWDEEDLIESIKNLN
jgi:hypothetical protein